MRSRRTPWPRCNPACVPFLKVKPDFQGLVWFNTTRKPCTPSRVPNTERKQMDRDADARCQTEAKQTRQRPRPELLYQRPTRAERNGLDATGGWLATLDGDGAKG